MAAKTATRKVRISPGTIVHLDDGTVARYGEVVTVPAHQATAMIKHGQAEPITKET